MIHQPASSYYKDKTGEFILDFREIIHYRRRVTKEFVKRTRKPLWVIWKDMERDVFMSATEAQAYRIVDLVGVEENE